MGAAAAGVAGGAQRFGAAGEGGEFIGVGLGEIGAGGQAAAERFPLVSRRTGTPAVRAARVRRA